MTAYNSLKAQESSQVENLQVLRFIAAGMVLVSHVLHQEIGARAEVGAVVAAYSPFDWVAGVDIFFVISGFVMFYICHDRFGSSGEPLLFLRRRVARVAPTYWLFTCLFLLVALLFPTTLTYGDIAPEHLFASLAFLPWPDQKGEMFPPLMVGWTLNYEALFYVAFAAALCLPKRLGLSALVAGFVLAAALHNAVPDTWRMLKFWTDPIIVEFLMGIGLAAVYLRGWRLSPVTGLAISVGGFGLLSLLYVTGWQPPELRFLWAGVPALLICAGLALSERGVRHSRIYDAAVLCGSASYALYLSHLFTVKLIGLFWRKLAIGMPWLFILLACSAAVLASIMIYLVVEKPLVGWFVRALGLRDRPQRVASPPSPESGPLTSLAAIRPSVGRSGEI